MLGTYLTLIIPWLLPGIAGHLGNMPCPPEIAVQPIEVTKKQCQVSA